MAHSFATIISGVRGRMGQALIASLAERSDQILTGALENANHPDLGKKVFAQEAAHNPTIVSTIQEATKKQSETFIDFTTPEATLGH